MSTTKAVANHPPRKIINYPIPCDTKGGALFIYGNADSKTIALVSAGYADDQSIFAPFATRLAKETDTLVGVTCLPGFDDRDDKPWTDHMRDKKDGYSFDEIATCFREAAKALRSESSLSSRPKFTAIFHDWGVAPGSMWSNRAIEDGSDNAPDEIVYFDVLPPAHPENADGTIKRKIEKSIQEILCEIYYRIVLATAFKLQRYLGSVFGISCLILGFLPFAIFPLSPILKVDDDTIANDKLAEQQCISRMIYMAYPYSKINWSNFLFKGRLTDDCCLPKDLSKVPVLYLYGKEKRAQFHEDVDVRFLASKHEEGKNKSNVIAVDGAGHYLYIQKADECFDAVTSFMEQK